MNSAKARPFPAYTLTDLEAFVTDGTATPAIVAEIARRKAVLAGDIGVMFPNERRAYGRKITRNPCHR